MLVDESQSYAAGLHKDTQERVVRERMLAAQVERLDAALKQARRETAAEQRLTAHLQRRVQRLQSAVVVTKRRCGDAKARNGSGIEHDEAGQHSAYSLYDYED